jgi:elongation factor P
MALDYTDLKKGLIIVFGGEPYEVLEASFLRMQQRKAVMQTKLRNLINGKVIDKNFQPSDQLEEAEIIKKEAIFIYTHKGEYWFHLKDNPQQRFCLKEDVIGEAVKFLKPNTQVGVLYFNERVIKINLPIKMDFKVIEAPPVIKGNTASGGGKQVVIETGAKIDTPFFIEVGDIIKVNTETGTYVERVEKK